jgi:hypothetical protein
MENFLVILGAGGAALIVALVTALLTSQRIRRHGLFGALRHEISATSRIRNPYRG